MIYFSYASAQNVSIEVDSAHTIEFGGGLVKEINADKIGYETFTPGSLDIVGAGTTFLTRKIKFWNEGGATFRGRLYLETMKYQRSK